MPRVTSLESRRSKIPLERDAVAPRDQGEAVDLGAFPDHDVGRTLERPDAGGLDEIEPPDDGADGVPRDCATHAGGELDAVADGRGRIEADERIVPRSDVQRGDHDLAVRGAPGFEVPLHSRETGAVDSAAGLEADSLREVPGEHHAVGLSAPPKLPMPGRTAKLQRDAGRVEGDGVRPGERGKWLDVREPAGELEDSGSGALAERDRCRVR